MTNTTDVFIARRNGSDFDLFVNNFHFGRLADCECAHVFVSDDEELNYYIGDYIYGDMSIREMLAAIRAGYEAFRAEQLAISDAEIRAENAWLRAAEYNAEHQDEMYREDMMGLT